MDQSVVDERQVGTHIPAIAEKFPAKVLTYLEKSNNEIYHLLDDVPRYIALGVSTLKIQGREYPTPLIAQLTTIYRKLIDQARDGQADVAGARAALDPVLAERDQYRNAKTRQLHGRLMARMSEDLHRRLMAQMQSTDWDPAQEEQSLRRAEPAETSLFTRE